MTEIHSNIDPKDQDEAFALIGRIIVAWGGVEKQVVMSIRDIESAVTCKPAEGKNPEFTPINKLKYSKTRRGHLRHLIDQFGTKEQLSAYDKVSKKIAETKNVRDAICHDIVIVTGPQIIITGLGDLTNDKPVHERKMPSTTYYTIEEFRETLGRIEHLSLELIPISSDISTKYTRINFGKPP